MKIKYVLPVVLITLSACLKVKKKGEAEVVPQVGTQTEAQSVQLYSESKLNIQYIPSDEPNNYTAHISWQAETASANSALRFILPDGEVLESDTNEINIPRQSYDKPLSVTVDQVDQGSQKLMTHFKISLKAPYDWVVNSAVFFGKDEEVNAERIFFLQGAEVYTGQFNVKFRAKKLISTSGVILGNFPEGSEAALETAGLSGGVIDVKVEQAVGGLSILINGQRGGHGRHGYATCRSITNNVSPACNPNSGADSGDTGELSLDIYDRSEFKLVYKRILPEGGRTGEFKDIEKGPQQGICSTNWEAIAERKDANLQTCIAPFSTGKPGKTKLICVKNYQTNKFDCE